MLRSPFLPSLVVSPFRLAIAYPAEPVIAIGKISDAQVVAAERMPVHAVRLASVDRYEIVASERVGAMVNRFKVGRIHARSVPAQMIDLEFDGNWSDEPLVDLPVHQSFSADRVVTLVARADPNPTLVRTALRLFEGIPDTVTAHAE